MHVLHRHGYKATYPPGGSVSLLPGCLQSHTQFVSYYIQNVLHLSTLSSTLQRVLTAVSSMHCLREAACTSAAHSVVTSSAAAATTLFTL